MHVSFLRERIKKSFQTSLFGSFFTTLHLVSANFYYADTLENALDQGIIKPPLFFNVNGDNDKVVS